MKKHFLTSLSIIEGTLKRFYYPAESKTQQKIALMKKSELFQTGKTFNNLHNFIIFVKKWLGLGRAPLPNSTLRVSSWPCPQILDLDRGD